ncbi:MAG TPA: hypothetical protein VHO70_15690 [Chitinispirillaceae bacterium]|nr:hypothetical protein [Chitinispirillaceae bacterium]
MNHNRSVTIFSFSHAQRTIMIIAAVCLSVTAQESLRVTKSLSFVFLPIQTTQLFQAESEQFMDEFIKVLRIRGHNAVSTRYLKSLLLDSRFGELEDCTTSVCMSQLVKVVGTRFLIRGSLLSDSSRMYVVNLTVVDVPNNRVLTEQKEIFATNPGISASQTAEFTDKILKSVDTALSATGVVVPVASYQSTESTVIQPVEMAEPIIDTIDEHSDSAGSAPGSADSTQNLIIDSLVEQTAEIISDSSLAKVKVDTADTDVNTLIISNPETDSGKALDTGVVVYSENTTPPPSLSVPLQEYQTSGPGVPPEALKRENVRKRFKALRISTCGTIALAAFTGGIAINSSVKKSLDQEKVLFRDYMNADKNQTETTYQRYLSQTDKTDVKMRQRSFLYMLGVLGLAGCAISIKF